MAIVQVKDATGSVLDWMVAKAYYPDEEINTKLGFPYLIFGRFNPSVNWVQGGPIITQKIDALRLRSKAEEADLAHPNPNFKFKAEIFADIDGYFCGFGPTPLIAAMRCYVASKLGDTVEVPDELI